MDLQLSLFGKLVYWLVYQAPSSYWRLMVNVPKVLMEVLGLKVHAKHLFVPMFHDMTWVGRGLSFFFRLAIVFSGTFVWIGLTLFLWLAVPFWLIMPFLGLIHLNWLLVWLGSIGVLLLWRLSKLNDPWGKLEDKYSESDVLRSLPENLSRLVIGYPDNLDKWWDDKDVKVWLLRMGLDVEKLKVLMNGSGVKNGEKDKLLRVIFDVSKEMNICYPNVGEVMYGLAEVDDGFEKVLEKLSVNKSDVKDLLQWFKNIVDWTARYAIWDERYVVPELAGFNRALTGTPTPVLNAFSYDLTMHANSLPEAVGRDEALSNVLKVLSKEGNKHVMVIGPTGSGKTTFVGGLAQAIMRGGAPEQIANKRLVKLEPGRLIAGVKNQGALAERLVTVLGEIKRSENIILFIDEVHTMLTEGDATGGLNMFSVLEEALFTREVQMIGATSIQNYKKFIEPNEAFNRLFEVVKLKEPDDQEALMILENIVLSLEKEHQVLVSLPAIKAVIRLSRRYVHDRALPDKAKMLLDEACVEVKENSKWVKAEDVAKVVTRVTGIPVNKLNKDEKKVLLDLEKELHKQYVNQDVGVKVLADALRRGRLGITEHNRPIGSFMFVGPTGVGKTELARRLSEVYFGSEAAMIRFDMSEFGNPQMVRRIIGPAPGESGYGDGGELTERVRRQPSSLLLLDEIEKAHPQVWDLLMQVVDEGRLSDASGLEIDFKNTIIIMTTNAVTNFISDQLEKGKLLKEIQKGVFDELLKTFKIEFLNRFDGIIPFGPLGEEEMKKVIKIQMDRLVTRLAEKQVKVLYTDGLVRELVVQGTDSRLGARPLRRLIQNKLESKLAKILLEREGEEKLIVNLDEDALL